ncbi:MAG: hypothetical protein ACFE8V_08570 [Promethearchaeota archaeon]
MIKSNFITLYKLLSIHNCMEYKFTPYIEDNIQKLLSYLDDWKGLFSIKLNYYEEGWAISLREKSIYARYIVIFKPYDLNQYSLKSFEIHFDINNNEALREIYFNKDIYTLNALYTEVKEVIFGKDIADKILRDFHK